MLLIKSMIKLPDLPESGCHECEVELQIDMEYVSVNVAVLGEDVEYLYAEDLRIIADHLDKLKGDRQK